jgi:hypothetical protein
MLDRVLVMTDLPADGRFTVAATFDLYGQVEGPLDVVSITPITSADVDYLGAHLTTTEATAPLGTVTPGRITQLGPDLTPTPTPGESATAVGAGSVRPVAVFAPPDMDGTPRHPAAHLSAHGNTLNVTADFRLRMGERAAVDGILIKFRTTQNSGTTVTNDAAITCHNTKTCPDHDDRYAQTRALRELAVAT